MAPRSYQQRARADASAALHTAILNAFDEIFLPDPVRVFTLDEVAERAGTSVQTILRHFGTKGGLIEAAARRGLVHTQARRDNVPVGDITAIVEYLAGHYESIAPTMQAMLAFEVHVPEVARIEAEGREMHRVWIERVFAPLLRGVPPREYRRRVATLIAVTSLSTWKVLRMEHGLSRRDYQRTIRDLVGAIQ